MEREMYHTQEKRLQRLNSPIICTRNDAWLGHGYYFWYDIDDAHFWGGCSKTRTGKYEIYSATIECAQILDTVFNEEQYNFWIAQIEKVAKIFAKKTNMRPTKNELNAYFRERAQWSDVDGILFQDIPNKDSLSVIDLPYRKRIQLVAFNLKIITNFALRRTENC